MIPGTIEEWKAALASSKPGLSRLACVAALMEIGQTLEGKHGDKWVPLTLIGGHDEYRVKPAPARGMRRTRGGMSGLHIAPPPGSEL